MNAQLSELALTGRFRTRDGMTYQVAGLAREADGRVKVTAVDTRFNRVVTITRPGTFEVEVPRDVR